MAMLTLQGGSASHMQVFRFSVMVFAFASFLNLQAQQPAVTDSSKTQPTSSQQQGAKPADGVAADAAKVSGSTFESRYFKFTCELPKGWKALDDAARVSANAKLSEEEVERVHARSVGKQKGVAKEQDSASSAADEGPRNYSLMVASPNGVDSLASPVLPRINIWANKRVPPLDTPNDHIQFLLAGRRTRILVNPQQLAFDGHPFVRASVITPNGEYHSQYVTIMGDYLVGFDFRAESERELVEIAEMMKSIRFQ